jgi:tetratricopeptide (TPR) repeat protein
MEVFKQTIQIKPDLAGAHYNISLVYSRSGMYREAMEVFKQVLSLWLIHESPSFQMKPDFAEAYNNLGAASVGAGMYREAIETFREAIQIKPDFADAHYNLGMSYLILNNKHGASCEYTILINLDPHSANKLFNLIYQ